VASKQSRSRRPYVALVADMISSRALSPAKRALVQEDFTSLIESLNRLYKADLRAKFVITLGDEFQCLIGNPQMIPELIWTLETRFTARPLRLGFGYGAIHTSIKEYAINLDGPALHNARAAIERAKRHDLRGGVFDGFGPALDPALNGFARVLQHQRANWPARQHAVIARLHEGRKGTEIAGELGITKQAVSRYASLAGWNAYLEAEQGWSALLRTLAEPVQRTPAEPVQP
jgi:hypothetical protein